MVGVLFLVGLVWMVGDGFASYLVVIFGFIWVVLVNYFPKKIPKIFIWWKEIPKAIHVGVLLICGSTLFYMLYLLLNGQMYRIKWERVNVKSKND
jgi:hypothetical protein